MNDAPHSPAAITTQTVLDRIRATRPQAHARLMDFLAIPSVSAQPAHAPDCRRAATWARAELDAIGFTTRLVETPGHPVLLATRKGPAGAPHLLYYGHYDVQPAEPFELWTSPPFTPTLTEGRHGPIITARGAVDDKGQVTMWLEALRAWHEVAGGPPATITVVLEGEEEVGSVNLEAFLRDHAPELRAADIAIISDTGMWDIDTPAITTRLRGLVYAELQIRGPSRDLHSGLYGGSALNPINALARILGALQDEHGRVQLPGFYDHVAETAPAQAAEWAALGFDEAAFLGEIGLSTPAGETGRPAVERLWARPTMDINGISGGYQGPGAKTVIASEASAKVSFRLVAGQNPPDILAAFKTFVAEHTPPGYHVEIHAHSMAPGFEVSAANPYVGLARQVLAEEYQRDAVLIGSGGSIPVVESLRRILGLDTLLIGFGLNDDQVHSPNEKFDVRCLDHGTNAHARLLGALAR